MTRDIHTEFYLPYAEALVENVRPAGEMTEEQEEGYTKRCRVLRRALERKLRNSPAVWGGYGRWSKPDFANGTYQSIHKEQRLMGEGKWSRGWYCEDHRPVHRCEGCGRNYACAICTNPYTCYHVCNTQFYIIPLPLLARLRTKHVRIELHQASLLSKHVYHNLSKYFLAMRFANSSFCSVNSLTHASGPDAASSLMIRKPTSPSIPTRYSKFRYRITSQGGKAQESHRC